MTASAARVIDRSPSPKCSLTAGVIVPAGRPMRTAAASGPNQSARSTNRMKPVEQNTSDRAERFFTGDCLCVNRFSSKKRRKTCDSQALQRAEVSLPSRPPSSAHQTTTLLRQLHPVVCISNDGYPACPARSGRGDTVLGKTATDTFGHKEELTQAPMRFGRHI